MKRSLYFDCTTGISGDMLVAAMLDLGADREVLRKALDSIPAEGFRIEISRVVKSGVDACDFHVLLDEDHENHDHDMAYLFGTDFASGDEQIHGHGHTHDHSHDHQHQRQHEHVHDHGSDEPGVFGQVHDHGQLHEHDHGHGHGEVHGHAHTHEHRHLAEIYKIIDRCEITEGARSIARKTFHILAEAEAEAHDSTPEEVGFHEAGALDSIVDIIAASVCLDNLAPDEVYIPVLYEGRGTVRCQHGVLPVPVPAVVNIVREHRIPLHIADYRGEYVTPTGAAFAAAAATTQMLPEQFRILKTGSGAGKRAYAVPGLLRAMLIEEIEEETDESRILRLECNIDDATGEEFGYVLERLFEAGARDVHYFPVYMKKNRPAYQLNVLCMPSDAARMEEIIFRETSTIGIRRIAMERSVLPREVRTVETSLGSAEVKVADLGTGKRFYPEYRSAVTIASAKGLPLRDVMRIIEREAAEREDL